MPFTGAFEDRLAIRELIEAYADAVNQADAAAWQALWSPDASWSMPGQPRLVGREVIVSTWLEAMRIYKGVVFVAAPGSIVVDGARATARSYTSEVYDLESSAS
jgi:uncharacterized protein (TIGR02246 family)